ncbi:hypothetical protein [Microcystis phage Mae-JY04]|uniref:hypothetical protein n=1 Tax=Blastomonas sp. TaxID=1909299 RepID=UPI0025837D5C|nr:hypothetical protein [Blastomonas sp.]
MAGRKAICARDINAGPGSCTYWWDGCRAKAAHCFNQFVLDNGGKIYMAKADEWSSARDKALQPQRALDLGEAA